MIKIIGYIGLPGLWGQPRKENLNSKPRRKQGKTTFVVSWQFTDFEEMIPWGAMNADALKRNDIKSSYNNIFCL